MGVANYPADGTSIDALIRAADTALHTAKTTGRNRVHHT
ncbi:MAG: diguanylate cyclase domain-containing protein [Microbacteriaceae bacterium]